MASPSREARMPRGVRVVMASSASFASFALTPPLRCSFSSSPPMSLRRTQLSTSSSPLAAQLDVSSSKRHSSPDALTGILNSGVIACLRAQSAEMAMESARAAIRGGVSVLEIVMTTPGVLEVVRELRRDHPSCIIGVGTVLGTLDARHAVKAGAMFLMSPATIKEVLYDLQGNDALYIPGVMTPTEIYPMSVFDGAQYLSALQKPFSHIPMVVSQGITIVVLSDAIFDKTAMAQRNYDEICRLASLATCQGVEAVQAQRKFH